MRFAFSDDGSDDEFEEEPAHPIGFQSPFGKTWISLEPPTPSQIEAVFGRSTYCLSDDLDSDDEEETKENKLHVQSYPPLSSYIKTEIANTATLLSADRKFRQTHKPPPRQNLLLLASKEREDELKYSDDEEEDERQDNFALTIPSTRSVAAISIPPIPAAIQEALAVSSPSHRMKREQTIQQKVQAERQQIDEECRRNAEILSKLVLKSKKEAALILKQRQDEQEKIRKAQEARDEKERQAKEARDAQAAKEQKEKEEIARQHQQERAAAEQKQREADDEAKKKVEYIEKAKERVKYVIQVHKSVEPFEQNKAVGKRRLGMKKIARGKLNTLSESPQKIQQVATEVSQAIAQARQDDGMVKQALEQNQPGVTSDMKIGKRYLLDLIASNAMTRIQAESFSGVKGDAFPLAAMLSMMSIENKDFVPILEGHIYMVCPTAIPTLPSPKPNASEDELMAGLGMQKDKNGEFESFPRFLARTENIISFMADIQSSLPSSNGVLGGNLGAVKWLKRFLDLLPPAPTSPLPLLTAPVLCAFLTGAGHMLANKHADVFKKLLDTITSDLVQRLDEGEVGKPSSIRLKKIVDGGFEHFRISLPAKAIPELYYGASGESKKQTEGSIFGGTIGAEEEDKQQSQQQTNQLQNPFGGKPAPNPFGGVSPSISTTSFGVTSAISDNSDSPFGASTGPASTFGNSGNALSPSPFNASGNKAPSPSPFGPTGNNVQQTSPFGNTNSNAGFGNSTSSPSPFGVQNSAPSPSPFGAASKPAPSPSPFGPSSSSSPFGGASTAPVTPFGGNNNPVTNPSPFGNQQSSTATNASPFGGAINNTAPSPSPFGGGNALAATTPISNPNPSPFGAGSNTTPFGSSNPSSFGVNAPSPSPFSAQGSSPFGGVSTGSSKPFGSTSNPAPSPFGGVSTGSSKPFGSTSNPTPSPFASGQAPSPSPFSNQNTAPFGGGSSTPFGSSGAANPSPFGTALNAPSPSPFSNTTSSPFGASNSSQPFGSGSNASSTFGSSSFAGPSGFGGNSNQQSGGFGNSGGSKSQPCRFFAKGQCKYGANCRYSHDIPAGGNGGVFGGGNTSSFGGGTFGGGSTGFGGGGGFGTSTPFGGPRR